MALAKIEDIAPDGAVAAQCEAIARPTEVIPGDLEMAVDLLEVETQEQANGAARILNEIQSLKKAVEAKFEGPVKAAHAAWKAMTSWRGECLKPIEAAERTVKGKIAAWQQAEQRRRLEEQRRLEAEQARIREEERRRLEEEVKAQAAALEAEGRAEEAEALQEDAREAIDQVIETSIAPPVAAPAARVEGVSVRENWKAQVTDLGELVRAAAANPQLLAYLQPNQPALNGMARALKGAAQIPGVRVWNEPTVAGRR